MRQSLGQSLWESNCIYAESPGIHGEADIFMVDNFPAQEQATASQHSNIILTLPVSLVPTRSLCFQGGPSLLSPCTLAPGESSGLGLRSGRHSGSCGLSHVWVIEQGRQRALSEHPENRHLQQLASRPGGQLQLTLPWDVCPAGA